MSGPVADPPVVHRGTANEVTVKLPRVEAEPTIDGVLDERRVGAGARADGVLAVRAGRRAASRGRDDGVGVVFAVGHLLRHPGRGRAGHACAPPCRAAIGSRPTTRSRSTSARSTTAGRRSCSPSIRSACSRTARWSKGTRSSSGGFSGLSTGREAPDLSPDFVFQSKGRLTDDGLRDRSAHPVQERALAVGRRHRTGALQVVRVRKEPGRRRHVDARRAGRPVRFWPRAARWPGLTGLRRGLVLDLNPIGDLAASTARRATTAGDYGNPAAESAATCAGASRRT